MEATAARARLARVPELSAAHLTALIAAAGGEPVRALEARSLRALELPAAARSFLAAPDAAQLAADLDWLASSGATIVLCTDAAYPPLLRQSPGRARGAVRARRWRRCRSPQLAMVGSPQPDAGAGAQRRASSPPGSRAPGSRSPAALPLGIDAASHEGALQAQGLHRGGLRHRARPRPAAATRAARRAHRGAGRAGVASSRRAPRRCASTSRAATASSAASRSAPWWWRRRARPARSPPRAWRASRAARCSPSPAPSTTRWRAGCHQLLRDGAKLVESRGRRADRAEYSCYE